jgi:hypothetical protein
MDKNISYSSLSFRQSGYVPQSGAKTALTKLGDCKDVSTLFVSLAKEVGINANLVLVDTRNNGVNDMTLPSIDFNHCIAHTVVDGKEYFLEMTSEHNPFATCGSGLNKAIALEIPAEAGGVKKYNIESLNPKNRLQNSVFRTAELTIANNRDINLTRSNVAYGEYAANRRQKYKNQGKDFQEKELLKTIANDFKNSVKLKTFEFKNLDNLSDSVVTSYSIGVSNELTEINGMKLLRIPWLDAIRSVEFVSAETRVYPFAHYRLDGSDITQEEIVITIPEGKNFVDLPENTQLSFSGLEFSVTYKKVGNKLFATRQTKFSSDVISEKDYQGLKDFYNKIADCDGKFIGFK